MWRISACAAAPTAQCCPASLIFNFQKTGVFPHYRQRGADFEFLLGRASSTAEIAGVGAESIQRPLRFHLTSSLFVLNFPVGYNLPDERSIMSGHPAFGTANNGQTFFRWEGSKRRFDDRIFFAILAESAVAGPLARKAIALNRELGLQGWFVPENHIHISLVGLGDHDGDPEKLVEIARHIGSMIVAKPFDVSFDRLTPFGVVRWFCATVTAIQRSKNSGAISPSDFRQPAKALSHEVH